MPAENPDNQAAALVSLGAISGATICCANEKCSKLFQSQNNKKRFCSDACRKLADKASPAFARRQVERAVRRFERKRQHEMRRRQFTRAYTPRDLNDFLRRPQGGVPRAVPRQLPELTPEGIQRYHAAKAREVQRG